jgi:hypothetical protein
MTQFAIEAVEGAPRARGKCCVALDAGGSPHIAYATEAGHVAIASRSGGWAIEEVFGSGIVRPEIEERVWLAIGADGNPQIAFIGGEGTLVHGARRDGAWIFSQLPTNQFNEPGGVTGFGFRLHPGRLTPELRDTPHFVAGDLSTDSLIYVRPVSGAFRRTVITAAVDFSGDGDFNRTGLASSMIFDAGSETIQVAYAEEIHGLTRLRLRRILDLGQGGVSNEQVLEQNTFVVGATSTWTGSETWVAYCDVTNGQLKVATTLAGELIIEQVADVLGRMVPSLARNDFLSGRPEETLRIAYSDRERLKLATRRRGQGWGVEEIAAAAPGTPSLAYDRDAKGHIAYTVGSTLKHVTLTE